MTILIKSGDPALLPLWQDEFSKHLPGLKVRWWTDTDVDPKEVRYVFVWEPEPNFLNQFPHLSVIFSSGAGVDHITVRDPSYPKHVPIVRMFTPESAQHMADHVLMCALMATRHFPKAIHQQATKQWHTYETPAIASQVTVGIMGLGNLGLSTAQHLHQAGFRLIGWSRSPKTVDFMTSYAGDEELGAFLQQTQILISLLPQTAQTHHILNQDTLAQLPQGASVINVGRGGHLDTDALQAALDSNHLHYAFLDVFEEEPLAPTSWLWSHQRVIVTPHVAANAPRAARIRYVCKQIKKHENGQQMDNIYHPDRGY